LRAKDQKRAELARSLRRALTPAEFALWTRLRGRQFGGFKFVRQEPLDRYYVDFVCRKQRLIVELDGSHHAERTEDRRRDGGLCALGYRVIRIWDNEVIENLDGALKRFCPSSKNRPSPLPSPRKRGEGDNRN
jgi:very-short-patch-repair endonuclease